MEGDTIHKDNNYSDSTLSEVASENEQRPLNAPILSHVTDELDKLSDGLLDKNTKKSESDERNNLLLEELYHSDELHHFVEDQIESLKIDEKKESVIHEEHISLRNDLLERKKLLEESFLHLIAPAQLPTVPMNGKIDMHDEIEQMQKKKISPLKSGEMLSKNTEQKDRQFYYEILKNPKNQFKFFLLIIIIASYFFIPSIQKLLSGSGSEDKKVVAGIEPQYITVIEQENTTYTQFGDTKVKSIHYGQANIAEGLNVTGDEGSDVIYVKSP